METKECTYCHNIKLVENFHRNKRHEDGRDYYCKECRKVIYKEKEYYKRIGKGGNGIEPKPIITKDNIKGKECSRCDEWKPLTGYHKFKRMSDGLEIYCKECRKEMLSDYFQTEKGKNNAHRASAKRRSRMKQAKYIPYDRVALLRRDKYTCQSCGIKVHDRSTGNWNTPDKAHLDHIVSLENGGETREENLQVLCRTCNLSKSGQNKGEAQMTLF